MHRIAVAVAGWIFSGCALAPLAATAHPGADGFIFSGDKAFSALDQKQFIAVGEKLSVAQLKKRFPSYTVTPEEGESCGEICVSIEGKQGAYILISYEDDRSAGSFYRISSDAPSSRDTLGNTVGASLRKAIGADAAKCDLGAETTCESVLIKGLSYIVGGCDWRGTTIPVCAKVQGFEIFRWKGGTAPGR